MKNHLLLRDLSSGVAPALLGQIAMWDSIERSRNQSRHNYHIVARYEADNPLSLARQAIEWLVARHEALRTVYFEDANGKLWQRVLGELEVGIQVKNLREGAPEEEADSIGRGLVVAPFDHGREISLRAAVGLAGEHIGFIILGLSHMAADNEGMEILEEEIASFLSGRLRGQNAPVPQPRELAEAERSAAGTKRSDNALEYWVKTLTDAPSMVVNRSLADPQQPRFREVSMRSAIIRKALQELTEKTGTSEAAIMLAAVGRELGRLTDLDNICLMVMVHNRSASLKRVVGTLAIEGLFTLDLNAGDFTELASRAWKMSLQTYRSSQFDKIQLRRRLQAAKAEHADALNLRCWFNYINEARIRAADDGPTAADRLSTSFNWLDDSDDQGDGSLIFQIRDREEYTEISLCADTEILGSEHMIAVLRTMEEHLADAARVVGSARSRERG
ncbi:condensation domain-containing protein [Streptomyces sp. MB09-02B]|uniref:condensation domain-containing protein n=1 Tax=Streptomyces sp. MB09-02B TaxID=3028667 RepID=UPI0029A1270E|nr:condensation domain-containing protein [Streptomyces sp. MB09-02B]MDX3638422.1 condensation domain-containing protein [Streptomyces sp. MB09-02B]